MGREKKQGDKQPKSGVPPREDINRQPPSAPPPAASAGARPEGQAGRPVNNRRAFAAGQWHALWSSRFVCHLRRVSTEHPWHWPAVGVIILLSLFIGPWIEENEAIRK